MIKSIILLVLAFIISIPILPGQTNPPVTREEMDSLYESNIKKSRINGVYIPKDLEDAYEEFLHLSPDESIVSFKNTDEERVVSKLHFGLGRWMIVNWNLYEGSRLSYFLTQNGVLHPDDMADVLIRIFHRKLNGKELAFDQMVESYRIKREEERKKKGSIHLYKAKK